MPLVKREECTQRSRRRLVIEGRPHITTPGHCGGHQATASNCQRSSSGSRCHVDGCSAAVPLLLRAVLVGRAPGNNRRNRGRKSQAMSARAPVESSEGRTIKHDFAARVDSDAGRRRHVRQSKRALTHKRARQPKRFGRPRHTQYAIRARRTSTAPPLAPPPVIRDRRDDHAKQANAPPASHLNARARAHTPRFGGLGCGGGRVRLGGGGLLGRGAVAGGRLALLLRGEKLGGRELGAGGARERRLGRLGQRGEVGAARGSGGGRARRRGRLALLRVLRLLLRVLLELPRALDRVNRVEVPPAVLAPREREALETTTTKTTRDHKRTARRGGTRGG